jgi:hypothetical protein
VPISSGAPAPDFKNQAISTEFSACREIGPKHVDFETEVPDWAQFRTLDTLGQKAGVPPRRLRRLALKELVDNALDEGAEVSIKDDRGIYTIRDNGPGMGDDPQAVANLFSINRPMRSTKRLRKPQRGALGNGLRVVAGSLIASGGGRLVVTTRGNRLEIEPLADGGAKVKSVEPIADCCGTSIEISFGQYMPTDEFAIEWAMAAINMAQGGAEYSGKSSAHWFDAESFHELIHWSGARPVRDLIANLDGCTGAKAGEIVGDLLKGRTCESLTRAETTTLLRAARKVTIAPNEKKLGAIGIIDTLPDCYAIKRGRIHRGARVPQAELPFVVEAWAETSDDVSDVEAFVNRTPITGDGQNWACQRRGAGNLWLRPRAHSRHT